MVIKKDCSKGQAVSLLKQVTEKEQKKLKSGFVTLIGRPNSGKSTLLNNLLGEKVSIVSNKPQTTRNKILGICTRKEGQIVFIDTPGIHKPGYELNRRMMQAVHDSLEDVNLILVLVDATTRFGNGDRFVLDLIKEREMDIILLLNKIDLLNKVKLLPLIDFYSKQYDFIDIIPISGLKGDNCRLLLKRIFNYIPDGNYFFSESQYTDCPERFLTAEMVREKVLHYTRKEIPYSSIVTVNRFEEDKDPVVHIYCDIFVEKESQKKILIGANGKKIKTIGIDSRIEIEKLLGKKIYLNLFVRVKPKWRNDPKLLDQLLSPYR